MRLSHEFSVPAPIDVVWAALLDPERVAPCMPGATLESVEGNEFRGTVKVKLGPVSLLYKGTGKFEQTEEATRTVVIAASGKDSRGNGTAAATVTVTLSESGAGTSGAVETDLNITGKPAQFGRGMIAEVSGKILASFAECLADKLATPEAATGQEEPEPAASPDEPAPQPKPQGEAIDLMDYAGGTVAKRALPAALAAVLLAVLFSVLRRKRARRGSE
ncbi:SRPBCC family protein [Sciscionella sediminilitoris]|uniref:SRPBCC family protein n=1 Tax=Sciscionella sediminilitoris TaxID=1445613 RepID=UPI0004DF5CF4|nr:SRPBCC family protein [Sciscionella sp. SE31]